MRVILCLVWLAFLPFLSGCMSMLAVHAANPHKVPVTLYNSADRIGKAAVTEDNRLCVFFEEDLTNSSRKVRFTLTVPLSQFQAQEQYHDVNGANYYFATRQYLKGGFRWRTLQVPGSWIRTDWVLPAGCDHNLEYIRSATELTDLEYHRRPSQYPAVLDNKDFELSNTIRAVYLTRTSPIEFVYVAPSTNGLYTIVSVRPTAVSKTHTDRPAYYLLLPVTVPADIATFPLQAVGFAWLYFCFRNMGC